MGETNQFPKRNRLVEVFVSLNLSVAYENQNQTGTKKEEARRDIEGRRIEGYANLEDLYLLFSSHLRFLCFKLIIFPFLVAIHAATVPPVATNI